MGSLIPGSTICTQFPSLKGYTRQGERSYRSCHIVEGFHLQKVWGCSYNLRLSRLIFRLWKSIGLQVCNPPYFYLLSVSLFSAQKSCWRNDANAAGLKVLLVVSNVCTFTSTFPGLSQIDNALVWIVWVQPGAFYVDIHPRYFLSTQIASRVIMLTLQVCRSRGVLLALRNAASFIQGGKIVHVAGPGKQLCAPSTFSVLHRPNDSILTSDCSRYSN